MSRQYLVKETQAENVDGYPALLREMMWRANFTYQPSYAIYRRDRGPGMEEYLAVINIIARRVTGSIPYCFQARGTSEAMALQEVARVAMSHLRYDLTELSQPPYYHFPMCERGTEVDTFARIQFGEDPQVRQLARLVHTMDQIHRCAVYELYETRQRLVVAQENLQLMCNMGIIDRHVVYGANEISPYASAPPMYRLPEVPGHVPNYGTRRQVRMSVGFARTRRMEPAGGHVIEQGSPLRLPNFGDPDYTGSPEAHLLDEFPVNFDRNNI